MLFQLRVGWIMTHPTGLSNRCDRQSVWYMLLQRKTLSKLSEKSCLRTKGLTVMRTGELEARIAALEDEVARLKRTVGGERGSTKPWWEQIAGTFAQDRMYKEAMTLGRQHRRSESLTASKRRVYKHDRARHRSS